MTSPDHGHHGIAAGKVDQFESVFRAATKTRFEYSAVQVESVLVVSDRDERAAAAFGERVRSQFSVLERGENIRWRVVHGGEYHSVPALLDIVETERPGLICTYRHLHSDSWQWPYTLGEYIDVLSQVTTTPIIVLPHPDVQPEGAVRGTKVVMAMTDHLVGDHMLVNWAARFTDEGGRLVLANVEDAAALEAPLRTIAENAGFDPGDVLVEVSELKGSKGFNALTGEYSDLVKDGVIDPTDVALTALHNAVSIAGLNLTTDALITDVDDHDEPVTNAVT